MIASKESASSLSFERRAEDSVLRIHDGTPANDASAYRRRFATVDVCVDLSGANPWISALFICRRRPSTSPVGVSRHQTFRATRRDSASNILETRTLSPA